MRRYDSIINVLVVFGPLFLACAVGLASLAAGMDPLGVALLSLFLYLPGLTLFGIAKASVIRQGHRFSAGTRHMSPANRSRYVWGYILMGTGAILTIGLLMAGATLPAPRG